MLCEEGGGNTLKYHKREKEAPMLAAALCACVLFLIFRDPALIASRMRQGLALCASTLIPTLFPFMILSELLVRSNIVKYAEKIMNAPMRLLFGVSGACAGPLILGIACGFPVGARTAVSLYSRGAISRKDAQRVISFCNCPSYAFTVYAVGESLWKSRDTGIFLYFVILGTTLFYAVISSAFSRKEAVIPADVERKPAAAARDGLAKTFTSSVTSASGAMIGVCAYVLFFYCAVGSLASMLGGIEDSPLSAAVFAFFELTSGASACASLSDARIGIILTAAAGCWSGLSVHLQIYSLITSESCDVSFKPYLFAKSVCSLLAVLFTALALFLFPSLIPRGGGLEEVFLPFVAYPKPYILGSNLTIMFFFLFYLYKKLDRRRGI